MKKNMIILYEKNLCLCSKQILLFIRDFLSLIINLHFINLESSKFNKISFSHVTYFLNVVHNKVIYPKFFDLYQTISFMKILIPLFYHIYVINQKKKMEILNEIQEEIFIIIFGIYLNGVNIGLSNFIFFINELDWFIYDIRKDNLNEKNNDRLLFNFIVFFFKGLQKKISSFELKNFEINETNESRLINYFKKEIFPKKGEAFNLNILLLNLKKYSKKLNNFKQFIFSLGYQNFDYLLIKTFLLYFEIFLTAPNNLSLFYDDYILLIIFSIFLCTNVIAESYSKSIKKSFFIELVLLSIKSIYLYLIHNFNKTFIQIFMILISLISHLLDSNQLDSIILFVKERNAEREFKQFLNLFSKYYHEKNNYNYEKIYEIIFNNKDMLKFLRNPRIIKNDAGIRFQIIVEKIFSQTSHLNFNYFKRSKKTFFQKLEIEKDYRRIKKQIFSWNNSFSDINLFYNEKGRKSLKFKVLNHYTEEMTLPILVPILNLRSFLPSSHYKYFRNNFKLYDIIGNSILDEKYETIEISLYESINEEYINCEDNQNTSTLIKKKNKIQLKQNDKKYIDDFFIREENNVNINHDFLMLKKLNLLNFTFYSCCLIKPGLHITGYIIINKDSFDFIGFPREINDMSSLYCDEKNICYGTLRKFNNFYYLNVKNEDIQYIYKKYYAFKDDALEIFTKRNKSYYFEFNNIGNKNYRDIDNGSLFPSTKIRNKIFFLLSNNNINSDKEFESIKLRYLYKGKDKRYKNLDSIYESFSKNLISKLEFLIRINLISNRSFKDINQYPIFPWIISHDLNYGEKKSTNINSLNINLRPLNIPMGRLNKENFDLFQQKYNELKNNFNQKYGDKNYDFSDFYQLKSNNIDIKSIPIFYENHFSKPEYICYYLNRLLPYSISTQLLKENNLNKNNKNIFFNLETTYTNSINDDLKELIPELYYQPELFRNINDLNLGTLNLEDSSYNILKKIYNIQSNKTNIDGVILPFWSRNNPEKYISIIREVFERPEIKINDWINLIFGCYQKGEEAIIQKNIFSPFCYQGFIKLEQLNIQDRKEYIKYFNQGINPNQIFYEKIKEKSIKTKKSEEDLIQKEKIYEKFLKHINKYINKLINKKNNIIKEEEDRKKEEEESEIDDETIITEKSDKSQIIIKIEKKINEGNKYLKKIKTSNFKSIIYKTQFGILYNYYPGEIFIFNFKENKLPIEIRKTLTKNSIYPFKLDNSEITSISIDKYFLFGTKLGSLLIYKPGSKRKYLEKIIHPHTKSIISLDQNNILHLIISSSEDGYINIYTMPNAILINSIYLPFFLANYVLFSYSPLPSFLVYNIEQKIFKVYSINGRFIIDKIIQNVNKPKIERNKYFFEYLKINDEKNSIVYKLPYLKEINLNDINNDEINIKLLNEDLFMKLEGNVLLKEIKTYQSNCIFFDNIIKKEFGAKKKEKMKKIKIK